MIDHFTYGPLTPAVAYAVSVIGAFVGLMFATRARNATGAAYWTWLVFSAICIGGTAVWSMHFIAMMGFRVSGMSIRYDVTLTVLSGLLAILVMGIALHLAISYRTIRWLLVGGAIAGVGIVSMHYMGMASINLRGHLGHNPLHVTLATAIALVAATVSLWFALRLRGMLAMLAASLVMGVAVSSMHYIGMFGMHVVVDESAGHGSVAGSTSSELLLPLVIGLFIFLLGCSLLLMLGVDDTDTRRSSTARDRDGAPASPSSPSEEDSYAARHRSGSAWDR